MRVDYDKSEAGFKSSEIITNTFWVRHLRILATINLSIALGSVVILFLFLKRGNRCFRGWATSSYF